MTGILGKALAGAGSAMAVAGTMSFQDQLNAAREARLAQYQADRDERYFGQQTAMQERSIAATREEGKLNRDLTRETGAAQRALTREEGAATRGAQKELAEMHEAAATKRHGQSTALQAATNARLDKQLALAKTESEMNMSIKEIERANLRDMRKLQEEAKTASPERLAQIREIMSSLSGKSDRFLEVGEYNDMGQRVGSKLFDTVRRTYVGDSAGATLGGSDPFGLGLKPKSAAPSSAAAGGGEQVRANPLRSYSQMSDSALERLASRPSGVSAAEAQEAQRELDSRAADKRVLDDMRRSGVNVEDRRTR